MDSQGRSRLNCVCKCRIGLRSVFEPANPHFRRGEGVHPEDHAHAIGRAAGFAAGRANFFGRLEDRFEDDLDRQAPDLLSASTTAVEFFATCDSAAGPYRCWLPVRYQISCCVNGFCIRGLQAEEENGSLLATYAIAKGKQLFHEIRPVGLLSGTSERHRS